MSNSPEFNLHTDMLCDSLRTFLERGAVEVEPLKLVGSGLLGYRSDRNNDHFRPRLVVAFGAADMIGRAIGQDMRVDLMVIGATREDDPTAAMGRIFVTCPGTAKDMLKDRDLEDWEIAKLSHSIRSIERETPGLGQAGLYLQQIGTRLSQPSAPNLRLTSY